MAMKEIIAVKVPKVQVGDIICGLGTPDHNRTDGATWKNPAGLEVDWFPAHKVLEVEQTHQAPTPTWWLVTESLRGQYVNELGPFGTDSELHVVARSTGDALIGRGK